MFHISSAARQANMGDPLLHHRANGISHQSNIGGNDKNITPALAPLRLSWEAPSPLLRLGEAAARPELRHH